MPATRTIDRTARRAARGRELVDAALEVFTTKGVAAASVDDIVRAAGVAKGTFYLYFETKDDAVTAVAERMVEGVTARIETLANDRRRSPVERLARIPGRPARGRRRAPRARPHRGLPPAGEPRHPRPDVRADGRPAGPDVAAIIADGMDQGLFRRQDADRAAVYVLACYESLHDVVGERGRGPGGDRRAQRLRVARARLRRARSGNDRPRRRDERPDQALPRRRPRRRPASTCASRAARSTPSSGSTARASRRRSGCCSG